jgi:hypothetical protein
MLGRAPAPHLHQAAGHFCCSSPLLSAEGLYRLIPPLRCPADYCHVPVTGLVSLSSPPPSPCRLPEPTQLEHWRSPAPPPPSSGTGPSPAGWARAGSPAPPAAQKLQGEVAAAQCTFSAAVVCMALHSQGAICLTNTATSCAMLSVTPWPIHTPGSCQLPLVVVAPSPHLDGPRVQQHFVGGHGCHPS